MCPSEGLIFGARLPGPAAEGRQGGVAGASGETFTAYDFRHRRLTELATTGNLPEAAYVAGHLQVTTLNKYAKLERQAA